MNDYWTYMICWLHLEREPDWCEHFRTVCLSVYLETLAVKEELDQEKKVLLCPIFFFLFMSSSQTLSLKVLIDLRHILHYTLPVWSVCVHQLINVLQRDRESRCRSLDVGNTSFSCMFL